MLQHVLLAGSFVLSVASAALAQTDISVCGQTVSGDARLVADLNCVEADEAAVFLVKGRLELNGHTIDGYDGVSCDRKCEIVGPGAITNTVGSAAISGNNKIIARNVSISNSAFGVASNRRVTLVDSSIVDSGTAIQTHKADIRGSTITGNDEAVRAHRTSIDSSTVSGNGIGVLSYRKLDATLSAITGNELDIRSFVKPTLLDSTCETSRTWNADASWGVCSLD